MLLFSDYSIIRAGLKHILGQVADYFVIGETEGIQNFIQEIEKNPWDVVIADFSLEGDLKLDLIKQLRNKKNRPPMLIISPDAEDSYLKRGFQAGAAGYLQWDEIEVHLLKAIDRIGRGGKYVDPKLGGFFLRSSTEQELPHDCLSDREYQVLCQLSMGRRAVEVAEKMTLSPKTIHTYRKRIQEKMQLDTYEEIVQYGRQWLQK